MLDAMVRKANELEALIGDLLDLDRMTGADRRLFQLPQSLAEQIDLPAIIVPRVLQIVHGGRISLHRALQRRHAVDQRVVRSWLPSPAAESAHGFVCTVPSARSTDRDTYGIR